MLLSSQDINTSCLDFTTQEMKLEVFILAWSIVKMLGTPERPELGIVALSLNSEGDRRSPSTEE